MTVQRILLDLDDVCNVFTMWLLHWVGCPVNPHSYKQYPAEVGYDIVGACNVLHARDDWTPKEFWGAIPRLAWATVPVSPEYPWILQRCEALVGRENILLSTRATDDPDCLAGKLEWIQRTLPTWMHRRYEITPIKEFGCREDTLLIDDSYANIQAMVKAGGQGLLVPRPWNPLNQHNPRMYLDRILNHMESLKNSTRTPPFLAYS